MKRAFTRIELLLVLAVVMLLIGVRLPALGRVQTMSKIAQCAANLKADAMAVQMYGADNRGNLPAVSGGTWVWDLSTTTAIGLGQYGAGRAQMYDPSAQAQNVDALWNYGPNYKSTGYAWCFWSPNVLYGLFSDDQNTNLTPSVLALTGNDTQLAPYATNGLLKIDPARRVLLADTIISLAGQNNPGQVSTYKWVKHSEVGPPPGTFSTPYGTWQGASSSHLGNVVPAGNTYVSPLPLGGNEAMMDGRVKWYPFDGMVVHASASGGAGDNFWWQADPGKL